MAPEIIESLDFTASKYSKQNSNNILRNSSQKMNHSGSNPNVTINKDQKHDKSIMLEELAIQINDQRSAPSKAQSKA